MRHTEADVSCQHTEHASDRQARLKGSLLHLLQGACSLSKVCLEPALPVTSCPAAIVAAGPELPFNPTYNSSSACEFRLHSGMCVAVSLAL